MGAFSKAARPLRPGTYFDWFATAPPQTPAVLGGIIALPFTSDWGPFKTPTLVGSFQQYLATFGPTVGTPGYNAAWQAFYGEGGVDGRFGAGAVLCYRMGGSTAALATHTFQNTTPAAALVVNALYQGSYGNNISVTVQDHLAAIAQDELVVYLGTLPVETYVYNDTDIAGLVNAINANSSWIRATLTNTGTKLAYVANIALTGGNDGTVTTASDWAATFSALESQRFDILACYGLVDPTIYTALAAWAGGLSSNRSGRNANGQRFMVCVGGATDELASDAVTSAAVFNDGNFIRCGVGHVVDQIMEDANGNPQNLAPSQWCVRAAGVLAARGEAMSLTAARLPGLVLAVGANASDILTCLNGGVLVLSQDSDPTAPVKIEAARTTFTRGAPNGPLANPAYPYLIYRNPKFARTMQAVETEWTQWANSTIIGKLPVNNKTRDAALADIGARLTARETAGIVQTGWTVAVDQNPPPTDLDEFIALVIGLKFGRSVEQVYFTVNVG